MFKKEFENSRCASDLVFPMLQLGYESVLNMLKLKTHKKTNVCRTFKLDLKVEQ